ncbi:hypothetical protein GCM10012287_36590 [Streptomyces daqingensis]|uniref:Uncharacterized protein n=1 Tax=Streptomyces daqingensis TaxID=1472640 RepID=A0ABQ2MIB2_9ACTN|nr:hypothetical protein GCM10012287_36590 [Streptomyces daqingensis]
MGPGARRNPAAGPVPLPPGSFVPPDRPRGPCSHAPAVQFGAAGARTCAAARFSLREARGRARPAVRPWSKGRSAARS